MLFSCLRKFRRMLTHLRRGVSDNLSVPEIRKKIPVRQDENSIIQKLREILSAYQDVLFHQSFFHQRFQPFHISWRDPFCRFLFASDSVVDDEIDFMSALGMPVGLAFIIRT